MVHITELRIVMPLTVEEFRRGQRYANWKTNENAQEPGQGGTLLSSSPYYHEVYGEGMFTHSLYRLGNRLPDWVNRLVPPSALVVDEKSWITYPYMRTVITIPFFSRLKMEVESVHLDDDGSTSNALGLSDEELAVRNIDYMDLGSEKVAPRDYKKEWDPELVRPKAIGRGPLTPGWQKREKTLMCAYKVIKAEANYWGLATRAERLLTASIRQIFLLAHKNCFGLTDEWYRLSYEEVMALEVVSHERLNLAKGTVQGHELAALESEEADKDASVTSERFSGGEEVVAIAAVPSSREEGTLERGAGDADAAGGALQRKEAESGSGENHLEAVREPAPGSLSPGSGEDVESDLDTEFHEAEMQWSLEEELYAEQLLSDGFSSSRQHSLFGSGPQGMLRVPEACPVCSSGSILTASSTSDEGASQPGPPTLFCTTCSEFFCRPCFHKFHCTPRLRSHIPTPVPGSSGRHSEQEQQDRAIGQEDARKEEELPVEASSEGSSWELKGEESRAQKEARARERKLLEKERRLEERKRREAYQAEKRERKEREKREKEEEMERKQREKDEERERIKREKEEEKNREVSRKQGKKEQKKEAEQMEQEMLKARKDILRNQEKDKEEGNGSTRYYDENGDPDSWAKLKDPPVNVDGLPFLRQKDRKGQRKLPTSLSTPDETGSVPLAETRSLAEPSGAWGLGTAEGAQEHGPGMGPRSRSAFLPGAGPSGAAGAGVPAAAAAGLPRTGSSSSVAAPPPSLPQEALDALQEEYGGRPVELSEAALSLILTIYRSCGSAQPTSSAIAQSSTAASSSSRGMASFSFQSIIDNAPVQSISDPAVTSPSVSSPVAPSSNAEDVSLEIPNQPQEAPKATENEPPTGAAAFSDTSTTTGAPSLAVNQSGPAETGPGAAAPGHSGTGKAASISADRTAAVETASPSVSGPAASDCAPGDTPADKLPSDPSSEESSLAGGPLPQAEELKGQVAATPQLRDGVLAGDADPPLQTTAVEDHGHEPASLAPWARERDDFIAVHEEAFGEVVNSLSGPNLGRALKFKALTELLKYVDPTTLTHDEKLTFWINVYNTLALHGYLIYGIPKSHYKRVMFLNKVSYLIGGSSFSLLTIEHSILRAASHRPALAGLLPVQKLKPSDPAFGCALDAPEPSVTFALACGSTSSPPVRVYSLSTVRQQLQEATSWYLQQHVDLTSAAKVGIPKLLQWYAKDFAPTTSKLLDWVAANLPQPQREELLSRRTKKAKSILQVTAYDWSFMYLLGPPEPTDRAQV